jgi:hypothetical protein
VLTRLFLWPSACAKVSAALKALRKAAEKDAAVKNAALATRAELDKADAR